MSDELNPQAKEMADESMVRNLAAQAEAIWPQEKRLFDRYRVPPEANILDAGCGTGEISQRLLEMFPQARLLGVDIIDDDLERARFRCSGFGERVRFDNRSVFDLELPCGAFDLVVCRHVYAGSTSAALRRYDCNNRGSVRLWRMACAGGSRTRSLARVYSANGLLGLPPFRS
jgi:ubiquinone/menaquinone biosynthesis C-methylase UbiE